MVKDCLWKQALKWEGEPVLVLSLRTPELDAESRGARRINRYYGKLAQIWKARWETSLFPSACAALAEARAASRPFEPWSVFMWMPSSALPAGRSPSAPPTPGTWPAESLIFSPTFSPQPVCGASPCWRS